MPKGIKIHSSKNLEGRKNKAAKIIKTLKKLFPHAKNGPQLLELLGAISSGDAFCPVH